MSKGMTAQILRVLQAESLTLRQISDKLPQYPYSKLAISLGKLTAKKKLEHPQYGGVYFLKEDTGSNSVETLQELSVNPLQELNVQTLQAD